MSPSGPFQPIGVRQLSEELQPVSRFVPRLAASEGAAAGFDQPTMAEVDPFRPFSPS